MRLRTISAPKGGLCPSLLALALKNRPFSRAPPPPQRKFLRAPLRREPEKKWPFLCTYTHFSKENDTTQPNTDRFQRPSQRTHFFSGPQLSPCMGMQQGGPRRTGRQSPGYHFRSPGPPTARVLRDIRPKCKVRLYATCPRRARPASRQLRAFRERRFAARAGENVDSVHAYDMFSVNFDDMNGSHHFWR